MAARLSGGGLMRRGRYGLCDQTVTVYHREAKDQITRTVHSRAFLDFRKVRNVERTGDRETSGFLLVIPGSTVPVAVGDKVMLGEGPECATDAEWAQLIPTKVANLVVVRSVDPKYYRGELVHTEAGG